jgi:hypothetical protein
MRVDIGAINAATSPYTLVITAIAVGRASGCLRNHGD